MQETRKLFAERVELAGGVPVVASRLGVTEAYVTYLRNGSGGKRPSLEMARKIEDLLGVPMRSWTLPDAEAPGKPVPLQPVEPTTDTEAA